MKLIILGNELKQSGEQQHSADCFCGDREHLKHILFNLLDNAIKFTPRGGQVTLRVWRESDVAVFQVEDTGIGIPKHHLNLMFQTFQQLEKVYHRTYEVTRTIRNSLIAQFAIKKNENKNKNNSLIAQFAIRN